MTNRFQPYAQHQQLLLPPSLEELIGPDELVRVIDKVIEELDTTQLENVFPGGGRPSYHPVMMLKVLVYAYSQQIYSSRQIAKALSQNIAFMWLSGMQHPDFRTINRFRSSYLKEVLENIFSEVVCYLLKKGYIQGKNYFIDGTKLEADANKNSYVWRKNVERYKKQVQNRARELLDEIADLNDDEDRLYQDKDLPERGEGKELDSEGLKALADLINKQLDEKEEETEDEEDEVKKNLKKLDQEIEKLARYEAQEAILDGRNSYSKTDRDAVFMRLKRSDELRAAYNFQVGTENGFLCGFSVDQNANDAAGFIGHLERRKSLDLPSPERVIGDSIYGTEQNYQYIEENEIESYLKYPAFHREMRGKKKAYSHADFLYNEEEDSYTCPQGRKLFLEEKQAKETRRGHSIEVHKYSCQSCAGCPVKELCTTSTNRSLYVNWRLEKYKANARANLQSELGISLRKRRGNEVESIFGNLKRNKNYKRIRLRGLKKATSEMALICITMNLQKIFKLQLMGQPA